MRAVVQKGRRVLIALFVLMVLWVTGRLLFRYFVTDQITDKGGMENPDYMDETDDVYMQDGDHTYVDNEKLLIAQSMEFSLDFCRWQKED